MGYAAGASASPVFRPAGLAWVACAAALVLAATTAVFAVAGGDASAGALVPNVLGYAAVGSVLLARRPGHRMGPLLCVIALAVAFSDFVFGYARYAFVHAPGSLPFGTTILWLNTWAFVPATFLASFILPLVFPDGRLLSSRWRPVLWSASALVVLTSVGDGFMPQRFGSSLANLPNPYAIVAAEPLQAATQLLNIACWLVLPGVAALSLALRWRRSGELGRQQLKWLLATLPLVLIADVAAAFFPDAVSITVGAVAGMLLSVAIGVAVMRYRLYEIDVILSRAVLYGLLSAAVVLVYLTIVAVAGVLFGTQHNLAVQVIATVIAAAALWPIRGRVQRGVHKLFFGDRGAPYAAMARLGRQVEESAGGEAMLDAVVKTVADSLRLPYAALQLRQGNSWTPAAAWGSATTEIATFPLVSQRETIGRLLVGLRAPGEQLELDDERLLIDLVRQVGPTVHAVALRGALEASLARHATAREEDRRRLRRDLHDELGPTLASLTLGLDAVLTLADGHPNGKALQQLLTRLKGETQQAVADVRRIAYGLRPPALDQFGLIGSLREAIGQIEREVPKLDISLCYPEEDLLSLPAAVEVATYRIVTEALTNVTRHSAARTCVVRLELDRNLLIEVCDDGAGFPEGWRAGVGITAMRERAAELGGDLAIHPREPHGTTIAAWLPAGSPA